MKAIILAGGQGTRLQPLTNVICKQLLPVFDKPLIYYPLSMLMLMGIRDFLIISTPKSMPLIRDLLGDGSRLGITLSYAVQKHPGGIAEAFIIGEKFIAGEPVCLALGDNILYWGHLQTRWDECVGVKEGAFIVCTHSAEPQRYGVAEFSSDGELLSIVEKPVNPKSNFIVIGLYFYDSNVVDYAKSLKPSARGELEITDLNNIYLRQKKLKAVRLSRGATWFDVGTFHSLQNASQFISLVELQQGLRIACPEEVAFNMGFIDHSDLNKLIDSYGSSEYAGYLRFIGTQKD
jgi:glucose-1-phosphate thymidylyltransferase